MLVASDEVVNATGRRFSLGLRRKVSVTASSRRLYDRDSALHGESPAELL